MPEFSLAIASAFYEVKAYSPYIRSLMEAVIVLKEAGIRFTYMEVSGDAYVDRAKNHLVDMFLKSDFSHLMIIDSDLEWDVEGFGRLLKVAMQGAEFCGGAYRCKGDFTEYATTLLTEDQYCIGNTESGVLAIRVTSLPGGFSIYSRKCFERTRPALNTYMMNWPVLEAFRCEISPDGTRVGEDIYFQRKYMSQGGKIYLVPEITLTHYGVKGYVGNFDLDLRRRPNAPDSEFLIKNLRNEHKGEDAWIIGKGASLQYLTKDDIGSGPVITLNEAIIPVEKLGLENPIYSMQKDMDECGKESIAPPQKASLLIHERETPGRHKDYTPRYVFDNILDFDVPWNTPSSFSATYIAELFGCKKINYLCFDSVTTGDRNVCHYNHDGSFTIDIYDTERDVRQYAQIAEGLKKLIQKRHLTVEWITPQRKDGHEVKE